MIITTPHFLITVITKPEVAEHLIPNILNFKITYYIKEEFKGGTPGTAGEKDILKMQMLCPRSVYVEVMSYLKEYYVKGCGAVCYYQEANVPM